MLTFVLLAVCVPSTLACGYLGLLAVLATRREPHGAEPSESLAVTVVIPAHNEAAGVGATVKSLLATSYPAHKRRILVVADNCTDTTEAEASAAGAEVWARFESDNPGKGPALHWAFSRLLVGESPPDVIAVVDADTSVSPNFLSAIDQSMQSGARAVQVDYRVRNLHASWRTELMAVAMALFHHTRALGRNRIGASAGLGGNGMAFRSSLLREVPYVARSVVEDVEYGIHLALAGCRVHYLPHARVLGEMPVVSQDAAPQRRRWEGGRRALRKRYRWSLLRRAASRRSILLFDAALDLLLPPLSTLLLIVLIGSIATALAVGAGAALLAWSACWLLLAGYLARGVQHSELGWQAVRVLIRAPLFIAWKVATVKAWREPQRWVRTPRKLTPEP